MKHSLFLIVAIAGMAWADSGRPSSLYLSKVERTTMTQSWGDVVNGLQAGIGPVNQNDEAGRYAYGELLRYTFFLGNAGTKAIDLCLYEPSSMRSYTQVRDSTGQPVALFQPAVDGQVLPVHKVLGPGKVLAIGHFEAEIRRPNPLGPGSPSAIEAPAGTYHLFQPFRLEGRLDEPCWSGEVVSGSAEFEVTSHDKIQLK